MKNKILVRITTVPISLDKLLEGQLRFMNEHFEVIAISSEEKYLSAIAAREGVRHCHIEMTREITPFKDLKAIWSLYRFLKEEKPSFIHSHTPKAGLVGMLAGRLAGIPVRLHTVAGLPLMEITGIKRTILNAVEKLIYKCATKVYPNSRGLYDFIIEEKLTTPVKVEIIGNGSSNGIDTSHFKDTYSIEEKKLLKSQIGIAKDDLVFLFVGRMVGDKGINELVEAFSQIDQHIHASSLLLVGPFEEELDPLDPEIKTIIQTHSKIYHVGYKKDVRPFFSISNVLTFPSYREGFPNVVMQAGAMGLPSIVTDINGCNEIIENQINGLIIPVKNSESLKEAMLLLWNDPEMRLSLATRARSMIVDKFERQQVWDAILKEYEMLVNEF